MQGLQQICEEDLAFHVDRNEETHEMLVSGTGKLHVEVVFERLERKYGAGVLAGFPVVDVRVTLLEGQFHDVDSSEMAFKEAGPLAVKEALAAARPALLEPFGALT